MIFFGRLSYLRLLNYKKFSDFSEEAEPYVALYLLPLLMYVAKHTLKKPATLATPCDKQMSFFPVIQVRQ